jgi:hypothetical protein
MATPSLLKCPNPKCDAPFSSLRPRGFSRPLNCLYGRQRRRLQCPACGLRCTENVHKIHYRLRHKDPALNAKILELSLQGLSHRKISRFLSISEHSIRIRLQRLAQRALEFHHLSTKNLMISEPLAYDGLENFAASQYDPNNINHAVGRHSLFIYDFNFASLNRKGRMSPWQKRRLQHIVARHGRYDPKAIRIATQDILSRLHQKRDPSRPLLMLSDEHFQYRKVLREDLNLTQTEHQTVSSKACRNYQNILFSVNHADLVIRQNVAAFARETISFSKTPGRMCQRYALFMVHKNYMNAQFTKKQKNRPGADQISPAQRLGLCSKVLGFSDIFARRSLPDAIQDMNPDWQCFWHAKVPHKYLRSKDFNPDLLTAHS